MLKCPVSRFASAAVAPVYSFEPFFLAGILSIAERGNKINLDHQGFFSENRDSFENLGIMGWVGLAMFFSRGNNIKSMVSFCHTQQKVTCLFGCLALL